MQVKVPFSGFLGEVFAGPGLVEFCGPVVVRACMEPPKVLPTGDLHDQLSDQAVLSSCGFLRHYFPTPRQILLSLHSPRCAFLAEGQVGPAVPYHFFTLLCIWVSL